MLRRAFPAGLGLSGRISTYDRNPKPTDWQFIYFDNADPGGRAGHHDLTHRGQPISKIFVKTTLARSDPVSVTASPRTVRDGDRSDRQSVGASVRQHPICLRDQRSVEEDTFLVDGYPMSNFVLSVMVRAVQTSAGHQVRPSRAAEDTLHDDQGRLHDHQEEGKGDQAGFRLEPQKQKRFAHENRRGHRSEYRNPQGESLRIVAPTKQQKAKWLRENHPGANAPNTCSTLRSALGIRSSTRKPSRGLAPGGFLAQDG